MLKDILNQKGISVYKLSKETGIAYSTINDIVVEKTDIKNTSVGMAYRIAKYLELSIEYLYEDSENNITKIYLYNDGRNIILTFNSERVQFMGPKNLLGFHRINCIKKNVVYVDCYFKSEKGTIYSEEDYIDLTDVLAEFEYIIEGKYTVVLDVPHSSEREMLLNQSLLVSDNIALLYYASVDIPDRCVEAVSMSKTKAKAVIRLKDLSVISSTMSKMMLERAIAAVKRNIDEINEEVEEVLKYA